MELFRLSVPTLNSKVFRINTTILNDPPVYFLCFVFLQKNPSHLCEYDRAVLGGAATGQHQEAVCV